MMTAMFWLNGESIEIPEESILLIDFLRHEKHLVGTKAPCREGDCGSCQVLIKRPGMTWQANTSCLLRLQDLAACSVLSIEAIPHLNPLQVMLSENGASQCGFCSPGLVMASISWLLNGESLNVDEGCSAINGNLCRCTGYMGQRRAVEKLSERYATDLLNADDREAVLIQQSVIPADLKNVEVLNANQSNGSFKNPFVAGGTDIYLQEETPAGLPAYSLGFDVTELAVKETESGFALNARCPIETIAQHLKRLDRFPVFQSFNELFASLPIRRRATLGGNLANASPVGDGICLLMAVGASVETNKRTIAINDFFKGYKSTALQPEEIIEWIHIPRSVADEWILFEKVSRRQHTDIAVVNCCGKWKIKAGKVTSANIVIGGASPVPVRLRQLESRLIGFNVDDDIDASILECVDSEISPISDIRGSEKYRRLLTKQLIKSQWFAIQNEFSRCEHG